MPHIPSKSRDLVDENNKFGRNGNDSNQPYWFLISPSHFNMKYLLQLIGNKLRYIYSIFCFIKIKQAVFSGVRVFSVMFCRWILALFILDIILSILLKYLETYSFWLPFWCLELAMLRMIKGSHDTSVTDIYHYAIKITCSNRTIHNFLV